MPAPRLPRFHLLPCSQLHADSWHSILISLLRGLAALQVAAAHLRAELMPGLRGMDNPTLWYQGLAFATGFAHQAVLVFFVISGWLVGGSLLNKWGQPEALKWYAVDRISRLWTVLLPTFMLVLALGILTGSVDPRSVDASPGNPYSASSLIGNLVGLQTISVPQFGGNYPLWSLANESWYYLMFPLVLAVGGKRRAGAALALLLIAGLLPAAMTAYFALWLLGAAFSRIRLACGAVTRVVLLVVLAGLSVLFRLTGYNDDMTLASFGQDILLGLLLVLFLSSTIGAPGTHVGAAPLRRSADLLANFSFTLYVIHVPLLGLLKWLGRTLLGRDRLGATSALDLLAYGVLLGVLLASAYGFYRLFEARTPAVRRWLKRVLAAPQPGLRAM